VSNELLGIISAETNGKHTSTGERWLPCYLARSSGANEKNRLDGVVLSESGNKATRALRTVNQKTRMRMLM
jgi:hypothetical protein